MELSKEGNKEVNIATLLLWIKAVDRAGQISAKLSDHL
jgi:hypothetical protein